MARVKLLGLWRSPFSQRIEVALKLKGVEYEYIEEDIENKSPLLLNSNPVYKKIPVLLHNGKPICESLVILEYIDETWEQGPSILPKDPYERAMTRFWARFMDEKGVSTMWKACWSTGEEHEKAKEESIEHLKTLEGALSGKKFFGGDTIGMVDLAGNFLAYYFPILQQVIGFQVLTKEKFPKLFEWIDNYLNCDDLVKENLPPKEKLYAAYKARLDGAVASRGNTSK